MANHYDDRLTARLKLVIDRLQQAQQGTGVSQQDIEDAIRTLEQEVKNLEACFPFVYAPPPPPKH
jgi:hypothetical protein